MVNKMCIFVELNIWACPSKTGREVTPKLRIQRVPQAKTLLVGHTGQVTKSLDATLPL